MRIFLSLLAFLSLIPCASAALITTGLVLRLDGSDIDGDGNADVGAGSSVSQWNDKSGLGNHVTAAVAADEPTTVANFNGSGLNAVNFNGDLLSRTDALGFSGNPATTVFIVTSATVDGRFLQFGVSGASSAGKNYAFRSDSSWRFNNGNRVFGGDALSGAGPSIGVYRSAAGVNYGGKEYFLNGSTPAAQTSGGGTNNADFTGATRHTVVGAGWTGNNNFNQKGEQYNNSPIAEILVYNRELSLAEVEEVGFFLQDKWGITNSSFIPEPSTATLLGLVAGLGILRRRRR